MSEGLSAKRGYFYCSLHFGDADETEEEAKQKAEAGEEGGAAAATRGRR